MTEAYRAAGVDAGAKSAWLESLKSSLPGIGGFAGIFALGPHISAMAEPCLVAAADGVGTKMLVARAAGDFSTIGIDCVAMVVNDLLCTGARPLLFLDYLAAGRFDCEAADEIMRGLRRGCEMAGCELIGGETAELPGLLRERDFDLCGFGIGVVDRKRVIDGSMIVAGDIVIGLPSSGVHANGLSLARQLLPAFETDLHLARALLTPTRIYTPEILPLLEQVPVKSIAHVTGGGIPENLARVLPPHANAQLDRDSWCSPGIFAEIAEAGEIDAAEMHRVFNMGIGMCLVVAPEHAPAALQFLLSAGAKRIGEITTGTGRVQIEGVNL